MSCSNTRNPVGWFEIYVQDLTRAQAFYEATFEVKLQQLASPPGMPLTMLVFPSMNPDAPGAAGTLVKMEGKDSGVGGVIIYFSTEDCSVEAGRAAAHGGRIQMPKTPIGDYGFISLVYDTEGNLFGLHSMQ